MTEEIKFKLSSEDSSILSKVFGPVNANINQIQDSLGIKVKSRGNSFSLVGKTEAIKAGKEVIETLHLKAEKSELITPGEVHLFIRKAQSTDDKVDSGNLLKTLYYLTLIQQNFWSRDVNYFPGMRKLRRLILIVNLRNQ